MSIFLITTKMTAPLNGASAGDTEPAVSNFLTEQSLTNFAVMSGAILAAWKGLIRLSPSLSTLWVPLAFAFAWGVVSIFISFPGLKMANTSLAKLIGNIIKAVFIAIINALVLFSAVVGIDGTVISTG